MTFHLTDVKLNNYTERSSGRFGAIRKILLHVLCMFLFISLADTVKAQKLEVPVKVEVDKGSADEIIIKVSKNGATVFSQTGSKNMKLKLDFNENYIISISKQGYVTKSIAFNTSAPADRIKQGFEPYKIGIKLFQQEEENIVMYNQPVGLIKFEESMDEFNFETDYSKSILSAFEDPDQKNKTPKEKVKSDAESEKEVTATKTTSTAEKETPAKELKTESTATNGSEEDKSKITTKAFVPVAGEDKGKSMTGGSGDSPGPGSYGSSGADGPDKGINYRSGIDQSDAENTITENITVTREDIIEKNRVIVKVKVSSPTKETNYSIVHYNWGGRYFFRGTTAINEALFTHFTGVNP